MRKFESHALRSPLGNWAQHPDLAKALDYIGFEAQAMVLDSLGCMFHNEGHGLGGNSEHFDAEWLARGLYYKLENRGHVNDWDRASEDARKRYMEIATECLRQLPELMARISSRYLAYESALRSMWDIARARKVALSNMYVQKITRTKRTA